jgi:hypothetical protein
MSRLYTRRELVEFVAFMLWPAAWLMLFVMFVTVAVALRVTV